MPGATKNQLAVIRTRSTPSLRMSRAASRTRCSDPCSIRASSCITVSTGRSPAGAPPANATASETASAQPNGSRGGTLDSRGVADEKKIRVVVAKPGLDGHDRGAKIIARALRDAGMEVIYTGLHQTPEQIVETAIQEDADAVGLSILSGAHMTLVPRVVELLREQGADEVKLVVGGTIPNDDIPELKELGVAEVFTPGSSVQAIVDYLKSTETTSS